ncbi:MAG: hypothetical protein J6S85_23010 [Methanobrevibacter sp.]|nr:hypothetical protein [Methanobrevibacter sp.]
MVKFRLYKGGLDEVSMEFDNPEELKNNPEIKKRLFDKDGNLMQLTTLNSEPKYERYFDYYSITISNSDGHWVEGHLESKDLNEVLEGCKKLNVIFLKNKK